MRKVEFLAADKACKAINSNLLQFLNRDCFYCQLWLLSNGRGEGGGNFCSSSGGSGGGGEVISAAPAMEVGGGGR